MLEGSPKEVKTLGMNVSARLRPFRYALITDIDETLVGNAAGLGSLLAWLSERREDVAFGVATGRVLSLALQPDVKQGPFKLSYDVERGRPSPIAEVEGLLRARGLHARLVHSQDACEHGISFASVHRSSV